MSEAYSQAYCFLSDREYRMFLAPSQYKPGWSNCRRGGRRRKEEEDKRLGRRKRRGKEEQH